MPRAKTLPRPPVLKPQSPRPTSSRDALPWPGAGGPSDCRAPHRWPVSIQKGERGSRGRPEVGATSSAHLTLARAPGWPPRRPHVQLTLGASRLPSFKDPEHLSASSVRERGRWSGDGVCQQRQGLSRKREAPGPRGPVVSLHPVAACGLPSTGPPPTSYSQPWDELPLCPPSVLWDFGCITALAPPAGPERWAPLTLCGRKWLRGEGTSQGHPLMCSRAGTCNHDGRSVWARTGARPEDPPSLCPSPSTSRASPRPGWARDSRPGGRVGRG